MQRANPPCPRCCAALFQALLDAECPPEDSCPTRQAEGQVKRALVALMRPVRPHLPRFFVLHSRQAREELGHEKGNAVAGGMVANRPCARQRRRAVAETIQQTLRHLQDGHRGGRVVIAAIVQLVLRASGGPLAALRRCEALTRSIGNQRFVEKPPRRPRVVQATPSLPDFDAADAARAARLRLVRVDGGADNEESEENGDGDGARVHGRPSPMQIQPEEAAAPEEPSSPDEQGQGQAADQGAGLGEIGVVTRKASEAVLREVFSQVDRCLSRVHKAAAAAAASAAAVVAAGAAPAVVAIGPAPAATASVEAGPGGKNVAAAAATDSDDSDDDEADEADAVAVATRLSRCVFALFEPAAPPGGAVAGPGPGDGSDAPMLAAVSERGRLQALRLAARFVGHCNRDCAKLLKVRARETILPAFKTPPSPWHPVVLHPGFRWAFQGGGTCRQPSPSLWRPRRPGSQAAPPRWRQCRRWRWRRGLRAATSQLQRQRRGRRRRRKWRGNRQRTRWRGRWRAVADDAAALAGLRVPFRAPARSAAHGLGDRQELDHQKGTMDDRRGPVCPYRVRVCVCVCVCACVCAVCVLCVCLSRRSLTGVLITSVAPTRTSDKHAHALVFKVEELEWRLRRVAQEADRLRSALGAGRVRVRGGVVGRAAVAWLYPPAVAGAIWLVDGLGRDVLKSLRPGQRDDEENDMWGADDGDNDGAGRGKGRKRQRQRRRGEVDDDDEDDAQSQGMITSDEDDDDEYEDDGEDGELRGGRVAALSSSRGGLGGAAGRARRLRLRSRNRVVDDWLGDEDGSDAYADLEDFLV